MNAPALFVSPADMHACAAQWRRQGETIGFVPTMGNLHAGHLSLVRLAQSRCDRVAVSIFVNPLQFGPNEDYARYPRTFETDMARLAELKVDAVFHPDKEALYPLWPAHTRLQADPELAAELEGANRPGHFDGVVTVVAKLFNIVQPDVAVFGQKDYQQLRIIQRMVEELHYPLTIVPAPIAREADGLAMSSRNQYLSPAQRAIAPALYHTLRNARERLLQNAADANAVCDAASRALLQAGFDGVDYFALRDMHTLKPWQPHHGEQRGILLAAARLGDTRLLDNLPLRSDA